MTTSLTPAPEPSNPAAPDALRPADRSSRRRWAVPAVVAAVVVGAMVTPPLVASAGGDLPDVTPQELLTAMGAAEPTPLSGTVVHTARLGLPEIPFAEVGGADPIVLLGGSSTLRVWTDGTERSRVALLGSTSEYSVVRDGPEAWTYSSADDEAVHYSLSETDRARYEAMAEALQDGTAPAVTGDLPTPAEGAQAALAHADESSIVTLDAPTTVAGRDAYQLVVTPRASGTLVARVVVAVDAETSVPLRVQAWSTQDSDAPALEIGFTDVTFAEPDPAVLEFSAPAGADVREVVVPLPTPGEALPQGDLDLDSLPEPGTADAEKALPEGVSVTGTGWETVVEWTGLDVAALVAGDPEALADLPGAERTIGSESAQELIEEFAPSDGSGHPGSMELDTTALYDQLTTEVPEGRLLSSHLLSVLVTTDGRVLVGAVPAQTLREMA